MTDSKGRVPWDVDIDTTRIGLERLGRALIETDSTLTCSMVLGDHQLGRGVSAFLRVFVPDGKEKVFREMCRPIVMKPPPSVCV